MLHVFLADLALSFKAHFTCSSSDLAHTGSSDKSTLPLSFFKSLSLVSVNTASVSLPPTFVSNTKSLVDRDLADASFPV